ncbi:MAG: hypothetical protein WKG06_12280 [Segetibacter sp.]
MKSKINSTWGYVICALICLSTLCSFYISKRKTTAAGKDEETPKIVNIINFIRLLEPRDSAITEDVLYQTVVKQVEIMKKYKLGGTFYYNTMRYLIPDIKNY